ncbi:hypothetical protein ABZ249_19770 [Nocardiopsis sp. NPDC006139]|uniref:hypothetical protein n=1 Tax=Nocardiopsis sp. NPDC006139 TaxID=3154578 RepID=UPI0033A38B68
MASDPVESFCLVAIGSNRDFVRVFLEILEGEKIGLRMKLEGQDWRLFPGGNLFKCLVDVRMVLEEGGFLLCCQGARPDVFPSGMQQQMDLGRFAYILSVGKERGRGVVDIFAEAEAREVVSVEEQRLAVYKFFGLPS